MGRFLNADAFASTGQGILGNNMFAYCLNNPVNGCDSSGNAYQGIYSQINYNEHDHTYGGRRENFYTLPEETFICKVEKYITNKDESVVLKAENIAFYNGSLVVYHSNKELTSWAIFGVIFLNRNSTNEITLAHEYGHILQERELGPLKYIKYVFIPSATYNIFSRFSSLLHDNYYNMPFEYNADVRGGVPGRPGYYADWAKTVSDLYFLIVYGGM